MVYKTEIKIKFLVFLPLSAPSLVIYKYFLIKKNYNKKTKIIMENVELLNNFKKYFSLGEIFSTTVVNKYGEQAWTFLDTKLIEVLLWLRTTLNKPITVNTKSMQQRGFRENTCEMVSQKTKENKTYCSAHVLGKGVDLDVKDMTAEEVRQWIRDNKKDCPHNIRLEKDVTWVHIDVCNLTDEKIVEFNG